MDKELKDKVAIITGSYGDIGNAIAEDFANHGMKLALLGRNNKKLQSQVKQLKKTNNSEIISIVCDVKDNNSFKTAIDQVFIKWNKIDILVNNAGLQMIIL